jgi:hypothetical protein
MRVESCLVLLTPGKLLDKNVVFFSSYEKIDLLGLNPHILYNKEPRVKNYLAKLLADVLKCIAA